MIKMQWGFALLCIMMDISISMNMHASASISTGIKYDSGIINVKYEYWISVSVNKQYIKGWDEQ